MAPALLVLYLGLDPTTTLVFSQVVLSFGIPFALVPLIAFTSSRELIGALANRPGTTVVASIIAIRIIGLNGFLVDALL